MWQDSWIPRPFFYEPISRQGLCRIRYVSDLLNDNGSWKIQILNQYFVRADVEEILKIRASPRRGDDVIAWGPEKLGVFSVKSAYHLAFDELHRSNATSSSTSPSGARSCWKFIWNCGGPPTVSNFAWRVATDGQHGRIKIRLGLKLLAYAQCVVWRPRTIFIRLLDANLDGIYIWRRQKSRDSLIYNR